MKNRKAGKKTLHIVFSLIVSVAVIIGACLRFSGSIESLVTGYSETYLKENVDSFSLVFESKLEDQQIMLESQARYFQSIDMSRYNDMKSTIISTKGVGAFKTIGVATSSGTTLNYNGESSGNIFLCDYFQKAMAEGSSVGISDTSFRDEDGDDVIAMAVPIIQNDQKIGVVFGTFDKNIISELLNTSGIDESRTNILLDRDGGILAKSAGDTLIPEDVDNFLTAIGHDGFDDSIVGKMFDYNNGEVNTKVILKEIGDNGWYFGTVVNENVIKLQSSQIANHVAALIAAIVLGLILLLTAILFLFRDNYKVKNENERFQTASEQNKDIVFEYVFSSGVMSVDGYVRDFLPGDGKKYSKEETVNLFKKCHPDDRSSVEELFKEAVEGKSRVTGEFRLMNNDGNYSWVRASATMSFNLDDSPYKIVGTVTNVDEQHERELLLKEKAELDPLTGIYNKGAFEERVKTAISQSGDDDIHALYIVDLDYFKAVNDTLGHAMGDQVLMDVAKKLCLVFTENDIVGRIGGDEFAVFLKLKSVSPETAAKIIEGKGSSICGAIKESYSAGNKTVAISSSVGAAVFPDAGQTFGNLFAAADQALYDVKSGGKNNYKVSREKVTEAEAGEEQVEI